MKIEGAMESSDKQLRRCFCISCRCQYFIPVYLFISNPKLYHIVFSSSVMYFATSYQGYIVAQYMTYKTKWETKAFLMVGAMDSLLNRGRK